MELKLIDGMIECPSIHFTPLETIEIIFKDISFNNNDIVLEPTAGRELRMYNAIPCMNKDYFEIDFGLDFLETPITKRYTKVITNPPYKSNHMDRKLGKNLTIKVIEKCFEVCDDECWFLLNNQMLNSLTPLRLHKYKELGFSVVFMRIINIKSWFGRYYWICFKKNGVSIFSF